MEKFIHLDPKTIELAGIAASVAGGCMPCLDYHFKKALEIGCTAGEAAEAVELGKMIKQKPISDIFATADKLVLTATGNNLNLTK
jgi:AhpD family alkylhydroperoxidase